MKTTSLHIGHNVFAALWVGLCLLPLVATGEDDVLEKVVDDLIKTKEVGFGYSTLFSGSDFLPRTNAGQWSTGVIGAPPPKPSEAMTVLVRAGAKAIPVLMKHMDDKRPTAVEPAVGMMWMGWNDEYDFNARTESKPPKGVNRDSFGEKGHPKSHQITVGDLCFVTLGQIVNRNFNATRYQPTAGLIVSSPTYSKQLLEAIRADYADMTLDKHRQQLLNDFDKPDSEYRRNGAIMRLAFYYPDLVEPLILKQLRVPTFDVFAAEKFVRDVLYQKKTKKERTESLNAFVASNGAPARDAVLLQLFHDLDMQIADEEHRLHPPLKKKHDARSALDQLFNYPAWVSPKDKPYVGTWNEAERYRFIESLPRPGSKVVEKEIAKIQSHPK